jgi:hypothetical protein
MASTSNKNTAGNYDQEQISFQKLRNYDDYLGRVVNTRTCLPGNGLLIGKMTPMVLSQNYTNIESELFGIGSTNLSSPKAPIVPQLKSLYSLDIFDKDRIIIPQPLVVEKFQRPFFIN